MLLGARRHTRRHTRRRGLAAALGALSGGLALALLAAACGTTPENGPASLGPALRASLRHFGSDPLLAPTPLARTAPAALSDDPAAAWSVTASVRVVQHRPQAGLTAFADAAALIAAVEEAAPIRTVAGPTRGTHYVVGPPAEVLAAAVDVGRYGARRLVSTLSGALPAGATLSVDVQRLLPTALSPDALPIRAGASVQLHRPRRAGAGAGADAGADAAPELAVLVLTDTLQRELSVARLPAGFTTGAVAVLVPWPVTSQSGAALLVSLELAPAPAPDTPAGRAHAQNLHRCLAEVARDALPPEPAAGLPAGLVSALQGLLAATPPQPAPGDADARHPAPDTAGQRGTLLYLAEQTGALLAQDLALSAEAATVDGLARSVLELGTGSAAVGETPALLGATLERLAYLQLLEDADLGDPRPEHEALLVLHAGEVGRSGALLGELLADQPTLDVLGSRIAAENLAYLDHSSPASRVRAHDWLRPRGLVPEGFDPLAPRDERRAALQAAGPAEHP
jgi:hypothetical protein